MTPANDNQPQTKLAEQLTALLEYRNRPDSPPDPLASGWSTDPSTVVADGAFDGDDEPEKFYEDLLLEITPSLKQIFHQIGHGEVVYGKPRSGEKRAPVVAIGNLRFSDGNQHERAYKRGLDGEVIAYMRQMPPGAMLGTTEKTGAAHGGNSPSVVSIGNTNLTDRLQPSTGPKIVSRPYTPAKRKRRKGRSYTSAQSRIMLDEAIANTPVLPPVTICPPGVASGTARYSDQFIGMKVGSTGKGGAPNWVDYFMAGRDYEEWRSAMAQVGEKHARVLNAALSARTLQDVGVAAGQSPKYAAYDGGGKRALIAANDNLAAVIKKKSA